MKIFKLIKLFIQFRKNLKQEEFDKPVFGEDPKGYGVIDPVRDTKLDRALGTKNIGIRVVHPEEGGVLTEMEGEAFPFPGYPDKPVVDTMANYKRMVPAMLEAYYPMIAKHKLKPEKYSKSVREVYRLFTLMAEREHNDKHIDRWKKVRDIVCIVLEFDNAYRFRFQDMIVEANMEELGFTEGDKHWAKKTTTYDWGFLTKFSIPNPKVKDYKGATNVVPE